MIRLRWRPRRRWRVLRPSGRHRRRDLAAGAVACWRQCWPERQLLARTASPPAHGYEALSLGQRGCCAPPAGSVLYLALVALLSLALAA